MMLTVIIPVGRDEPHVAKQVQSIKSTIGISDYEIIFITLDPNVCNEIKDVQICLSGPMNCAEARNVGAKMAHGDILVFSDAHTEFDSNLSLGWGNVVISAFKSRSDLGVATLPRYTLTGDIMKPTRMLNAIARGLKFNSDMNLLDVSYITPKNGEICFVWGDFHVMRRSVFDDVGGYITEGWGHFEDRCMCATSTMFGYKNVCIDKGVMVGAYIRPPGSPQFPYWYYGNMAFGCLHYAGERLGRFKQFWIRGGHSAEEFEIVFNQWSYLRDYYLKKRKFDDNWYFETFMRKFVI